MVKLMKRIEEYVTYLALGVLVSCVLWGVFTRYITARPAVWTTELSGIAFTWTVMLGAMIAHRKDKHIRVTLLMDKLPAPFKRVLKITGDLIVVVFLAYVTYLSYVMMLKGVTRESPVLRIPFSYVYIISVFCFAIMTINAGLQLIGHKSSDESKQDI